MTKNYLILIIRKTERNTIITSIGEMNRRSSFFVLISILLITLQAEGQPAFQYSKSKPGSIVTAGNYTHSDATATCSVTLINPLSIAVVNNMEFGTIALSGTDGIVVLDATTNICSASGGVSLQSGGRAPQFAEFIVTGEADHSFTVSFPSNIFLENSAGNTINLSLTVPEFQRILDNTGKSIVKIGGTLSVPAGAGTGTYTNTNDLSVTVEYN